RSPSYWIVIPSAGLVPENVRVQPNGVDWRSPRAWRKRDARTPLDHPSPYKLLQQDKLFDLSLAYAVLVDWPLVVSRTTRLPCFPSRFSCSDFRPRGTVLLHGSTILMVPRPPL